MAPSKMTSVSTVWYLCWMSGGVHTNKYHNLFGEDFDWELFKCFFDCSTLQGTNISPKNGILKMIFLFPRWDMLIPWRVSFHRFSGLEEISSHKQQAFRKRGKWFFAIKLCLHAPEVVTTLQPPHPWSFRLVSSSDCKCGTNLWSFSSGKIGCSKIHLTFTWLTWLRLNSNLKNNGDQMWLTLVEEWGWMVSFDAFQVAPNSRVWVNDPIWKKNTDMLGSFNGTIPLCLPLLKAVFRGHHVMIQPKLCIKVLQIESFSFPLFQHFLSEGI